MGVGVLEAVQEEGSPEDPQNQWALQEKLRRQSKVSLAWKNKYRSESRMVVKLKKEKDEFLESIQSQLFVFENQLKKGRGDLDLVVQKKDRIIQRQHQLICNLTLALIRKDGHDDLKKILPNLKLEKKESEVKNESNVTESSNNVNNNELKKDSPEEIDPSKNDFESLNDSDSAIMMEDAYDSLVAIPVGKGEIKVMRSVSDALEIISRGISSSVSNKPVPVGQSRRIGYGSLSSTPSCSSEESDDSPTSTITKDRFSISDNAMSDSISRLDEICSGLNSAFMPYKNQNYTNNTNVFENGNNHCCSRDVCESPSCWRDISSSTTPIASPIHTPPLSPLTLSTISSDTNSLSSFSNGKYESDSDATLSDGTSEEKDRDLTPQPPKYISTITHQVENLSLRENNPDNCTTPSITSNLNNRLTTTKLFMSPRKDTIQVTYNRVMSNHRSVTKPKDVKYKRINKAKSRSLEELRGKLKFVDGKQALVVSPDQVSEA